MCFLEQHNIALPLIVLSAFQLNTWQSKPSYMKNWKNSGSKYMTPSICIHFESKYMLGLVCVLVAQACPTLCNPMDCSPPGSSVHGILQAWIQEWVAISLSRGSSQPRNQSWVSCFAGGCFTAWATREAHVRLPRRFNIWICQAWDSFAFSVTNFWVKFGHFCYSEYLDWATELNWKRLPQGNFLCFHWKCICSSLWKRLKVYKWASGRGQTSLSTSIFKKQTCYYQVTLIFHFQIKLKLSSKNLYWKIPNFRKEFMFK